MATLFGHVREFDDNKEEWIQYVEQLDHLYEANGITENDWKRDILMTTIGLVTYKTLRNVVLLRKPGEMSYQDLLPAMKTHYRSTPSEIVQRFRFNSRSSRMWNKRSKYTSRPPSLMGRDWIAVFRLNWKEIYYIENCLLQSVLQQFTDVFKEGLSTL